MTQTLRASTHKGCLCVVPLLLATHRSRLERPHWLALQPTALFDAADAVQRSQSNLNKSKQQRSYIHFNKELHRFGYISYNWGITECQVRFKKKNESLKIILKTNDTLSRLQSYTTMSQCNTVRLFDLFNFPYSQCCSDRWTGRCGCWGGIVIISDEQFEQ